jgi:hypothetical protein
MSIPDELLTAYIDGELEGAERARVEQAIAQDAQLAQRVAQQRALRERLRGAYDGVLQEAVPQRLQQAARLGAPAGPAQVIDLASVRAERIRRSNGQRQMVKVRRYGIAATLAVGLMAGLLIERLASPGALTELHDGALLARGSLARALDEQLAGAAAAGAPVRVGLSFRSRSGNYCRTFALSGSRPLAGLACREQERWQLVNMVAAEGPVAAGGQNMRMAGSSLPPALLQAVNERISGEPLNAATEAKARSNGWH